MRNRIFEGSMSVSESQKRMLVWAFDDYGRVDSEMFMTICQHEGIDFMDMSEEQRRVLLEELLDRCLAAQGMTRQRVL